MVRMDDGMKIKIVKKPPQLQHRKVFEERLQDLQVTPPSTRQTSPREPKVPRKSPRYLLWFVAAVSIVFLFFSLSYTFSAAHISITPKAQDVKINESFVASKDPTSSLPFDLIVIEGEETEKLKATEQKALEVPSKGVAVLYNAFSAAPQTLSIDTRLEGSNGKMYKTEKRITIPGMTNGEPGKVEVGIYASATGPEYDSEPLDFKVFGFKGTNKYEKIYARSKTAISGGVKGQFYVVSESDKATTMSSLTAKLQEKLYKKAVGQIPPGFVLFKDAVFLKVKGQTGGEAYSKESTVPVTLSGTLYGFLFNEDKLSKKLATNTVDKYDGADVYVHNLKDLTFTLANKDTISFADVKEINFMISGDSKVVWKFDENKFKTELVGKKKDDFNTALKAYPNVASANLTLRPFWRMSLPTTTDDIVITVNYPK